MTGTAAQLVASAKAILLDFDGPVTPLMPPPVNRHAADSARAMVPAGTGPMPTEIAMTSDHLAVLRWAGTQDAAVLEAVEKACINAEVNAATRSTPTPGALDFLRACSDSGKPVVVVSNNSAEAVHAHLSRFKANGLVRGVVGRAPHHPELMKPHPSLVLAALDIAQAAPADTVLIGDSITDIEVSHVAGLRAIGYAKTPRRGRELHAAGADAVVDTLETLSISPDLPPATGPRDDQRPMPRCP